MGLTYLPGTTRFPHQRRRRSGVRGDGPGPGLVRNPAGDIVQRMTHGRAHPVKAGGVTVGHINVPKLRQFLISKGYDIPANGNGLGKRMKSALADFLNPDKVGGAMAVAMRGTRITGHRDPEAWNKAYGPVGPHGRSVVALPPSKTLDKHGNSRNAGGGGGGNNRVNFNDPGLKSPTPGYMDASQANRGAQLIDTGIANEGAKLLPKDLAQALAGNEFDTSIHDARLAAAHQAAQGKQNLADIGHWYDQVLDAQGKAAGLDHQISQAAQGSLGDANAAVLASLGGGANDAAGMVAAAGQSNLGTMQALGAAQDQYNADIAPLLKSEAAGASTREAARQSQLAAEAAQQINDLVHQKGSSVDQHMMDIMQYNNGVLDNRTQRLLDIMGENNGVRDSRANRAMQIAQFNADQAQQGFNNNMALQQAKEAAILGGAKIAASAMGKNVKGSFGNASPSDLQHAMGSIQAAILDPNTGAVKSGMTPARARTIAAQIASTYFPRGGIPKGWVNSVVGSILSAA